MLSKNQTKRITLLKQKKYRLKEGLFVVEGIKGVGEFLNSDFELNVLITSNEQFYEKQTSKSGDKVVVVTQNELQKVSTLVTAPEVLAVFKIPKKQALIRKGLTLVLDDLQDPGNLGTIIRLCDWFGVHQVVCSTQTVDCYNPKVVQATMGSLARVSIIYVDLSKYLSQEHRPVLGTFLEGESVYEIVKIKEAVLIMGNEANGITETLVPFINHKITIPQLGNSTTTESLNVATATAICLSEFLRP